MIKRKREEIALVKRELNEFFERILTQIYLKKIRCIRIDNLEEKLIKIDRIKNRLSKCIFI